MRKNKYCHAIHVIIQKRKEKKEEKKKDKDHKRGVTISAI
jgi:hypothetical protein